MDPQTQALLQQLDQMMTGTGSALTASNDQAFQEAVRQFNLNYTNNVASQYGYNTGVGQPASPYAPNLAAQGQQGAVGYVPGLTGYNADQTLQTQNDQFNQQGQSAQMTGVYSQPMQSQYTPGTFVQLDPNSQEIAGQNVGQQLAFVTPTGQLQHVDLATAQRMGFNGQTSASVPYQQFMQLGSAPPTSLPQTTLAALQAYSQLNSQNLNQAIGVGNETGVFTQPTTQAPPGTALDGSTFSQLPASTQQAYLARFPGDPQAAMQQWVTDDNQTINTYRQQQGLAPLVGPNQTASNPQLTQSAQNQFFNQALQQAGVTGMYQAPSGYAPGSYLRDPATGAIYLVGQNDQPQWISDPAQIPKGATSISVPGLTQSLGGLGSNGQSQETLAAQQQFFNQSNQLSQTFGQYYSPLAPGQTSQAGVNAPNPGQITEQGREFNVNTADDLAKLASTLTGPANYFQYLQALNGGNSILNNLYSGQAQSPGGQVGSTGGTQSIDNILGNLGLSTSALTGGVLPSGTYSNSAITPTISSSGQLTGQGNQGQMSLPPPNQVNPAAYNSLSPSGQQFVQGAYQAAGYNPQDLSWFMSAATPAAGSNTPGVSGGGTSGSSSHFANPASQSMFA